MGPFSEDSLLVSWDVVAMFPKIDNNLGINAVIEALEARPARFPSTDCIVEAVQICLKHNNSLFEADNFLQIHGTAMGPKNACSYADLAMGFIDRRARSGELNPICGGDTGMIFLISGHKGQSNSTSLRNLSTLYTPPLNSL